jgi:hypothetical protein
MHRLKLSEARTATGEEKATAKLVSVCTLTSRALSVLAPNPIAKPALTALRARLGYDASAYQALASAAAADDRRAYDRARGRAQVDDRAVQAHLRAIWTSIDR